MAYNENLVNRIREALVEQKNIEEKKMFQGLCFMVNDKMCICVRNNHIMCRIDPDIFGSVLEEKNCSPMIHNGKIMRGFVFVEDEELKTSKDLVWWINLSLEYNKIAKSASKKRK